MTPANQPDHLTRFRRRFRYVRDPWRDRWTLLTAPDGLLEGDCEDYAYTALWIMARGSRKRFWQMLWDRDAELWWTKFHGDGQPHVMLWVKGWGWTDSAYPEWSAEPRHPPMRRYSVPRLMLTLLLK